MFALIWVRVTAWGYRREQENFSTLAEATARMSEVRKLRCAREVGVWVGMRQVA